MGQSFTLESSRPREASDVADALLVDSLAGELDAMRATVCTYPDLDPADVLLSISGLAGRLAEVRVQLLRAGTQRCTALRTREVDPLREDLDLQFKLHSRRISMMEFELKMTGGAV